MIISTVHPMHSCKWCKWCHEKMDQHLSFTVTQHPNKQAAKSCGYVHSLFAQSSCPRSFNGLALQSNMHPIENSAHRFSAIGCTHCLFSVMILTRDQSINLLQHFQSKCCTEQLSDLSIRLSECDLNYRITCTPSTRLKDFSIWFYSGLWQGFAIEMFLRRQCQIITTRKWTRSFSSIYTNPIDSEVRNVWIVGHFNIR